MAQPGAQWEPTNFQIQASYNNKRNVKLARAIYGKMSWGTYDRHSAHRWALKLIRHNPQNGLELARCLANFTWMIEGAARKYETNQAEQRRCDEVAVIFAAWKAEENERAGA